VSRTRRRWLSVAIVLHDTAQPLLARRLPDVSLLHAAEAHYALSDAMGTVCFNARDNRLEGAADWLARLHLNYEIVGNWRLHEQDVRSGVLIVEHPKRLSEKTIAAVVESVRRGGTLLLTGMGVRSGGKRLRKLCGVVRVQSPSQAEQLRIQCNGQQFATEHHLFRLTLSGAEPVMTAIDQQGGEWPLLTGRSVGRGTAYYFATPLLTNHGRNEIPGPVVRAVFDQIVPASRRLISTDAPETVEVTLREQGRGGIVHLVNMAEGKRRIFRGGRRKYTLITDLPLTPECTVRVRFGRRPRSVVLQPQGTLLSDCDDHDGFLAAPVPSFRGHQMIVIE